LTQVYRSCKALLASVSHMVRNFQCHSVNRRWPVRYQSTDFTVFGLACGCRHGVSQGLDSSQHSTAVQPGNIAAVVCRWQGCMEGNEDARWAETRERHSQHSQYRPPLPGITHTPDIVHLLVQFWCFTILWCRVTSLVFL